MSSWALTLLAICLTALVGCAILSVKVYRLISSTGKQQSNNSKAPRTLPRFIRIIRRRTDSISTVAIVEGGGEDDVGQTTEIEDDLEEELESGSTLETPQVIHCHHLPLKGKVIRQKGLAALTKLVQARPDARTKGEMHKFLTTFRDHAQEWKVTSTDLQRIYLKAQPNWLRRLESFRRQRKWFPHVSRDYFYHDRDVKQWIKMNK